jgi:transposase
MSEKEQLIRARLGILALAAEFKNVARACKLAGVSRSQFYAMKKAYETYGKEGLAPRIRRKPEMPNRTPAPLEERILLQTRRHPIVSYIRLAGEIQSEGIGVTPTMVRYVWQRHGLSTRSARLEWVNTSNGRAGAVKTLDDRNGLPIIRPAASAVAAATSLVKSLGGGKAFTGKASGVDWNYWSQRVRETLTR